MAQNQDAASFWGLKLTNGLNYSTVVNQAFRISAASLDFESGYKNGVISVIFEHQGEEHVLCNLSADHNILQVPLDLQFCEDDKLCFSLRGAIGGVYLTGYYLTDADDLGFGEEDYSGEEEEEEEDSDLKKKNALQWVKEASKNGAQKLNSSMKSAKNTPMNQKRKQPQDAPSAKKAKTGVFSSLSELMNGSHQSDDDDDFELDDVMGDDASFDEVDEDELMAEAKTLMNDEEEDDSEDEETNQVLHKAKQSPSSVKSSPADSLGQGKKKRNRRRPKKVNNAASPVVNGSTPKAVKTPQNNTPFGKNKSPKNINTPVGKNKSLQNMNTPVGKNKSPQNINTPGGQKSPQNINTPGGQNKSPKHINTPAGQNKSPQNIKTPGGQQNKTPKTVKTPGVSTPKIAAGIPTPKSSSKKVKLAGGKVEVQDKVIGTGKQAHSGNYVGLFYEARLKGDNKLVEKVDSGRPFRFRLGANEVMKGWDVAISGMKVGGKRSAVINPSMAYGSAGVPKSIPPNSTLSFDFTLLEVN